MGADVRRSDTTPRAFRRRDDDRIDGDRSRRVFGLGRDAGEGDRDRMRFSSHPWLKTLGHGHGSRWRAVWRFRLPTPIVQAERHEADGPVRGVEPGLSESRGHLLG